MSNQKRKEKELIHLMGNHIPMMMVRMMKLYWKVRVKRIPKERKKMTKK